MKVDWFTVAAQVINFLLLIYLLRHFLYRPVTRAMAQREQAIAARLETAAARQVEAEQGAAEYRKMQQELAAQRDELLVTAREQAEAERRRLVEQARQEVASAQRRWEAALEREREAFLRELSHQVGVRFCAALRGALTDLSGADLEQRIVATFCRRLEALAGDERAAMSSVWQESDRPVLLYTAFPLRDAELGQLLTAVRGVLGAEAQVTVDTAPQLICGIEFSAAGRKLQWSVDSYVERLEEELDASFVTLRR